MSFQYVIICSLKRIKAGKENKNYKGKKRKNIFQIIAQSKKNLKEKNTTKIEIYKITYLFSILVFKFFLSF